MNLPPDFEFDEGGRLLIYRPDGVLNQESVNNILKVIHELEEISPEPFNRFWDASRYDDVDLDFKYTTDLSLSRRRETAGRRAIKAAIFATDPKVIHYARLLAVLTQGSPIKIRIFETCGDAAKWLSVPVEMLESKPAREQGQE